MAGLYGKGGERIAARVCRFRAPGCETAWAACAAAISIVRLKTRTSAHVAPRQPFLLNLWRLPRMLSG
jgi:hypothetical protein